MSQRLIEAISAYGLAMVEATQGRRNVVPAAKAHILAVIAESTADTGLVRWTMDFMSNLCGGHESDDELPAYILKTYDASSTKSTEDAWEAASCYHEGR